MTALQAVWDWLFKTSWQASILVIIVLTVQWALRNRLSARWKYSLWLLVIIRLILPVLPGSRWSVFNYARVPYLQVKSTGQVRHSTRIPATAESTQLPRVTSETTAPNQPAENAPGLALRAHADEKANRTAVQDRAKGWNLLPSILWLLGASLLALRIICQNIWFARRLRGAHALADPAIHDLLDLCRTRFGIRSRLRLAETDSVKSPALYGLIRPVLLLPKQMVATFSHQELRYVFLHELAHVKRCDMAVHWLATLLKVLHWFNPVLWFAFHRAAIDRELACDELALSKTEEAENKPYGETLIKLLENASGPEPIGANLRLAKLPCSE